MPLDLHRGDQGRDPGTGPGAVRNVDVPDSRFFQGPGFGHHLAEVCPYRGNQLNSGATQLTPSQVRAKPGTGGLWEAPPGVAASTFLSSAECSFGHDQNSKPPGPFPGCEPGGCPAAPANHRGPAVQVELGVRGKMIRVCDVKLPYHPLPWDNPHRASSRWAWWKSLS
jgi:hypothetical protein